MVLGRCPCSTDGRHKLMFAKEPLATFSYGAAKQEYNIEMWKKTEKSISTKINLKVMNVCDLGVNHSKNISVDMGMKESMNTEVSFKGGTVSIPIMFCTQCGGTTVPPMEIVKEALLELEERAEKQQLNEIDLVNKSAFY
ncbi:hypothetical protein FDP41_007943 [Naegleria fowleri]|uniref:Uncharacterized protein n=1 Tax=Naegleria fowleri TaxID=5763 RepID=A0A6A5CF09_NAEFO|nr:uncharacterized protein FDP41_007943 [Naegleria fowleri]KAF0984028.1 hypothetical protein FDP41_007943 [Naegleria fowleri]CAG4717690.1 unnamed protein product [Naegleria fowleri]